jgi:hypothetical protein
MPFSVIDKGSKYFTAKTYTGTGATQSISGLEFSPDWVWIKQRSGVTWHNLYDVIRGTTKSLASNDTGAEDTRTTGLTAFTSDGFTLGTDNNANGSSNTYVSWCWDANGAGVSNTAGTISSTVSANTTSGFSIVSYTGTGATGGTVGHGLGVAPSMIIVKNRNSSVNEWIVYTKTTTKDKILLLNSTNAVATVSGYWGSAEPTSSVFGVYAAAGAANNNSGNSHIAYCFAEVKGYSKFGSYTGNGSTDGPFVYTGFKPAWLMVKRSDSGAESWYMTDNKRGTYNLITPYLTANESNAEGTANMQDYLSNGFKIRGSGSYENASGGTYIYMAFAENPFVSSKGLPCTAR